MVIKASSRGLISLEDLEKFDKDINDIGVKLNNYINSIGKKNPAGDQIQLNDSKANDRKTK